MSQIVSRTWWIGVGALVLSAAVGVLALIPGCVDVAELRAQRAQGEDVVAALKSREAKYQSTLNGLPESDPVRVELESAVKRAELARDEVARRVQHAAALEEEVRREGAAADSKGSGAVVGGQDVLGQDLMDLVPGPWKVAAVLTVGLATSLVRSRQLREAASSIARSIDRALEEDAKLAERFRQHANTLRTIQTPLARKIVDQGQ